ncbi:hypothetical protein PVAND_004213 [Polypedilum vanderplanki]|uniref:Alanine--glyoxylate aminotransferase n=1 Tax=Polypedilum vanderplanki TaxID=319348 RepID=A0A9J6BWB6_POLVA|nr:hypothetical protein PVAND_004213 [Polypedilum vanderplanki]
MDVSKPDNFKVSLDVIEKTMTGAGPSNYHPRIRQAMSLPVLGHLHTETLKIMDDLKEGIKYLFQTRNSLTFCVSGPGHAALECALTNLIEENDVILIVCSGIWGTRAGNIAKRLNANVKMLYKHVGEQVSLKETRECFRMYKPKIFFMVHGESSTGMIQNNIEDYGNLCREFDCLFIVDCVITLGCTPLFVDKWKIDIAYTGTQKVLNAPPGISPITFSQRAYDKIVMRKSLVKSYNYDAILLGEYWNCFPLRPRIYHHTICSSLLYGLREAIAIFIENGGLEASWEKHGKVTRKFHSILEKNGLQLFIENAENRCPSVTSIKVPDNIDTHKIISYAMNKYKVEIGNGVGMTLGKIFRIGLMGVNCKDELAERVANILIEAIRAIENEKVVSKI